MRVDIWMKMAVLRSSDGRANESFEKSSMHKMIVAINKQNYR